MGVYNIRKALPEKTLKIKAQGWFNSSLLYCLPLFGGCSKGDLHDIQVIQNKLARLITFTPIDSRRWEMYEKLEWMTVNQLIVFHSVLTVYRIRKSGEPEDLATCLRRDNRNHNIIIPQSNLELYRKSFVYRAIRTWNLVPRHVRNLENLMTFKKHLKTWIFNEVEKFP